MEVTAAVKPVSVVDVDTIDIKIFPNPTSSFLTITANSPVKSVQIGTLSGRTVYSKSTPTKFPYVLDMSALPNGIYLVKVTYNSGKTDQKKIMVIK